jgi:hypothetical protein
MYEPDNNPFAADSDTSSPTSQRYGSYGFNDSSKAIASTDELGHETDTTNIAAAPTTGADKEPGQSESDVHDSKPDLKSCGCRINSILHLKPDLAIQIVDAGKSNEGSGGSYIAYSILVGVTFVLQLNSENANRSVL